MTVRDQGKSNDEGDHRSHSGEYQPEPLGGAEREFLVAALRGQNDAHRLISFFGRM